ncbi:MAG: response regulator [Dehalococcoidales bacterium]|nr:response regulator [Dehalococcoidales bacterium]
MDKSGKIKALIVEDESSIREICKRVLTADGYDVTLAKDGKIAEMLIAENKYDLILCDIRLPKVSGIDCYIFLQQEYYEQSKKMIFMTGSIMSSETTNFLEKSGRPYILKPFRPSELLELIHTNMGNQK